MTVAAACMALAGGCSRRHMSITSEPSGALVTVNDVEAGRTPLKVGFTYYGVYDVRVEKEGFEPLRTRAVATAPLYERMPLDLVTMMIPADIDTEVRWNFVLQPAREKVESREEFEKGLIERARELGARGR